MEKELLERFYNLLNSKSGDIIFFINEQIPKLDLPVDKNLPAYITQRPQGDYLGKGGEFQRQNVKKISSFDERFHKNISSLDKEYSCIPKVSTNLMGGKSEKSVNIGTRQQILMTIFFIRENKQKIMSAFNCDEKTLVFLFKLAIAAMDQQTGLSTQYQDNEGLNRSIVKVDQVISDILTSYSFGLIDTDVKPAVSAGKALKGKEPSIGPYQMQPSNLGKSKKTLELTGKKSSQTDLLYKDMIVPTLAVMEYFLNNYRKIKQKNGFSGPSVDWEGKRLEGISGDYNWDISIASYAFNLDNLLSQKYCTTDNVQWPAPCDSPGGKYNPSQDTMARRKKYTPNVYWPKKLPMTVNKNNVIKNYLPILGIGSDTTLKYIQWYMNYVNSTLSCIKSF